MLDWRGRAHLAGRRLPSANNKCLLCHKPMGREIMYMLSTNAWRDEAGLPHRGDAHLECVEAEIGRPLELSDFRHAPINWWVFPTIEHPHGWQEIVPRVLNKGVEAKYIKPIGTRDLVFLSKRTNGWSLSYFTHALEGEYAAARVTFQKRKKVSDALEWAEGLLKIYPPYGQGE